MPSNKSILIKNDTHPLSTLLLLPDYPKVFVHQNLMQHKKQLHLFPIKQTPQTRAIILSPTTMVKSLIPMAFSDWDNTAKEPSEACKNKWCLARLQSWTSSSTSLRVLYLSEWIEGLLKVKMFTHSLRSWWYVHFAFPLHSEKLRHALIRPHGSCSIVISMCESGIIETRYVEYAN